MWFRDVKNKIRELWFFGLKKYKHPNFFKYIQLLMFSTW
jgi:hypothetical protein